MLCCLQVQLPWELWDLPQRGTRKCASVNHYRLSEMKKEMLKRLIYKNNRENVLRSFHLLPFPSLPAWTQQQQKLHKVLPSWLLWLQSRHWLQCSHKSNQRADLELSEKIFALEKRHKIRKWGVLSASNRACLLCKAVTNPCSQKTSNHSLGKSDAVLNSPYRQMQWKWKSSVHHTTCVLYLPDNCKLSEMQCMHQKLWW